MFISPNVQSAAQRALLQIQKHAPTILTTVGIVSVVSAGVIAAKNTLKLEERIDEGKDRLDWVNESIKEGDMKEGARTAAYVRNVLEVSKLYVVPTGLMIGGVVCILGSKHILTQRNAGLAAAYNGLLVAHEAYRDRVREELGEEKERDLYYGEKTETREIDGKKVQVKVPVKTLSDGEHVGSPYRFIYDQTNDNWSGFHDDNLFRLQVAQNMYNDTLKRKGHVFLRDILLTLGIQDTPASAVTGWIYDPENPDHEGDNFIEFNVRDYQDTEGYILLDFNVDGTIFDKI